MRLPHHALTLAVLALTAGCASGDDGGPSTADDHDADAIVARAVATHGGDVLAHSVVSFDFRGKHFIATRDGGVFRYQRIYVDSTGSHIRETLDNDGFSREIDGTPMDMDQETSDKYLTSVNSVVYFALLPFYLNDPAVQKTYLGEVTVKGEPYDKIGVTFAQQGGGRDWEDRFVYWFHRDRHTMDYLAYLFHVDGGGTRFRSTYNPRTVGGVLFTDHHNYTASDTLFTDIERFDALYEADSLEHVSDVVLENVAVEPVSDENQ